MGIRPPSLYVYFPSKHALYDALFARGAQEVLDHVRSDDAALSKADTGTLDEVLLPVAETFVGWSVEHPAYTALLFWRPVPGFAPSAEAYAPAVELIELTRARFADLQGRGRVRTDAELDDVQRDWTVLLSGVISQQLSNAPGESLAEGRFTSALPTLVAMFARHYGAAAPTSTSLSLPSKENRRVRTR
jgi:AcrR family transcriptional regulator